jgi:hypothetical protein
VGSDCADRQKVMESMTKCGMGLRFLFRRDCLKGAIQSVQLTTSLEETWSFPVYHSDSNADSSSLLGIAWDILLPRLSLT